MSLWKKKQQKELAEWQKDLAEFRKELAAFCIARKIDFRPVITPYGPNFEFFRIKPREAPPQEPATNNKDKV